MDAKDRREWVRLSAEITSAIKRGERSTQWGNVLSLASLVVRIAPKDCNAYRTADSILTLHNADKRARPWTTAIRLASMRMPEVPEDA